MGRSAVSTHHPYTEHSFYGMDHAASLAPARKASRAAAHEAAVDPESDQAGDEDPESVPVDVGQVPDLEGVVLEALVGVVLEVQADAAPEVREGVVPVPDRH